MPNDALREEIAELHRAALSYLAGNFPDERQRRLHVNNLMSAGTRLGAEIHDRSTTYSHQLDSQERAAIESKRSEIAQDSKLKRAFEAQKANQQQFEDFRHVNGGGFPKNISPVLYSIPLVLVGVAEWYVNYSTFQAMFVPVFAISATLIVATVFAWASHLHGAYLKQISEILHPSVEYRNILGRKIALLIATALLIAAFMIVVWLRWQIISEQLGADSGAVSGGFGDRGSSMIWSKVAPTIIINLLIWGLGTLYSWALHEKVPDLRESYRNYLRSSRSVDSMQAPFFEEEKRLKAQHERERAKNNVAINEYKALLDDVRATCEQINQPTTA